MNQSDTENLEAAFRAAKAEYLPELLEKRKRDLLPEKRDFMNYMNDRLRAKGKRKQEVFLLADIPQGYGYKLLTEEKTTLKRDIIIRICFAAEFTIEELQKALKLYRMTPLYARRKRDACLLSCFEHRPGDIQAVNRILEKNCLAPLAAAGTD